jgi:hypothetical protein
VSAANPNVMAICQTMNALPWVSLAMRRLVGAHDVGVRCAHPNLRAVAAGAAAGALSGFEAGALETRSLSGAFQGAATGGVFGGIYGYTQAGPGVDSTSMASPDMNASSDQGNGVATYPLGGASSGEGGFETVYDANAGRGPIIETSNGISSVYGNDGQLDAVIAQGKNGNPAQILFARSYSPDESTTLLSAVQVTARAPDFYNFQLNSYIFSTSISVTRSYKVFWGKGASLAKVNPWVQKPYSLIGGSANVGWVLNSNGDPDIINSVVDGGSVGASAYVPTPLAGVAVGGGYSYNLSGSAVYFGIGTPGVTLNGETNSQIYNFNPASH